MKETWEPEEMKGLGQGLKTSRQQLNPKGEHCVKSTEAKRAVHDHGPFRVDRRG
jgi:hypothetical protein